ncbi:DC2like protein [Acanthamoeba castellanii str. Neff]|jgi:hypothetical protein|uniref:DC2like protein n=1 Tax=Acanthamoeba castellanii (strain ATCC 30010 / Neff) TaxID=1257118 RepID=L8HM13_ACACF|nr:DC2like protein [Acanthamoeba castellanii str. Neff]ELR25451.1 DC2like protein [Acanthamoeba castellanii str. Neff]
MDVLELPFHFLRVPNLRLRVPSVSLPGPMTVFAFVFLSCFLVFSGIIYDIIVEPPSIGSHQEPNGSVKPVVFLQYRINGQFIVEGLSAGFLFILGGFGVILLDKANAKGLETKNRYFLLICGGVCCFIAYNLAIVFLKMKLPNYQHS